MADAEVVISGDDLLTLLGQPSADELRALCDSLQGTLAAVRALCLVLPWSAFTPDATAALCLWFVSMVMHLSSVAEVYQAAAVARIASGGLC